MRKIYMLLAVALSATCANAQNQVFFDDFEDNSLEGYTLYNLDGLVPDDSDLENMADSAWTLKIITSQGWTFNKSAFSVSWYLNDEGPSDDWLVTPAIAIAGEAMLEWDALAITSSGNFRDRYQVFISPSSDIEVISIEGELIFDTGAIGEETTPQHRTVDLAALGFENQVIYICFRNNTQGYDSSLPDGNGNGGNELAIDNIEVSDNSPVSTTNVDVFKEMTLLPNPSAGSEIQVNFSLEKSTETTLEVVDITGKILKLENLGLLASGSHTVMVNRGSLASGIYFIRLRSGENTAVLRAVFN